MLPLLVLGVALGVCALIVYLGPPLAEQLIARLPPDRRENMALAESLFSLLIFGPLAVAALVGGRATGVDPLGLGDKRLKMTAIGLVAGVFGVVVATGYAHIHGSLGHGSGVSRSAGLLLWGTALVLFQAGSEEVYFRGWLQPVIARRWGAGVGVLIAAAAFAALHVMGGARSPTSLVNLFLGGLLFGFLAAHGRGIAGAVAAHFAWNASEQLLLGLDPNPGTGSFGALLDFELSGSAAWGGSAEGLNASLAMTVALFALLVPLLILARGRRNPQDAG